MHCAVCHIELDMQGRNESTQCEPGIYQSATCVQIVRDMVNCTDQNSFWMAMSIIEGRLNKWWRMGSDGKSHLQAVQPSILSCVRARSAG